MAVDFVRLDRAIAGVSPQAIARSDFNGDGNLDLATANTRSDSVSILLGDGTGDFQAIADITVGGSNPQSLVAGDFNSNGYPDIAVANLSGNVSILLSDGTGNFRYMSTLAVDDIACAKDDRFSFGHFFTPQSIATGDINGDGLLDLAIAGPADLYKDVLLLTGDGTGEFRFADGLSINGDVQDVLLTDVNGDGRVDVATTNDVPANGTDTVAVWLGNGSGSFGKETEVSLGTNTPKSLLAEDLNGDGNRDALTYDTVVYQDGEDVFALPAETTFEDLNFIVGSVEETPGTFITYIPNNEQILAFLPNVDPSAMSADDFLAV